MPFSNLEQITPILLEIRGSRPKSILDVGCGLGVYGFLGRIYLELYGDDENFLKKLHRLMPWDITIDAIEGFKDYLEFIPQWAYDEIMIGSAHDVLLRIDNKKYDVVLALAILEHFSKEEGITLLNELKRVGRKIIISVPKEWREQVVPGNEFETHRSHWTDHDLLSWGFNRFLHHPFVWIAVFDQEAHRENEDKKISFFSKRPDFKHNATRFLYKLYPFSPHDIDDVLIIKRLSYDSLRYIFNRYKESRYEQWALCFRSGRKIHALSIVETKGETLFVHDFIISERTFLKQLVQKLENLAVTRGARSIAIIPGIYKDELERFGYTPTYYSISHVHGI